MCRIYVFIQIQANIHLKIIYVLHLPMSLIQKTFNLPETNQSVRVVGNTNILWFCGEDVAVILGYNDANDAIKEHVNIKDRSPLYSILYASVKDSVSQSDLMMIYITESGLNLLITQSKLDTANGFKAWVTSVILPSISKVKEESVMNITF